MSIGKVRKGEYFPYIFAGLIIAGVVFRPIVILTFILMAIFVIKENKKDYVFAMLFFCMPFASAFKISANSASLFTFFQLLVVMKFVFCNKIKRKFLIIFFVYAIYLIVGGWGAFLEIVKQISYPLLFYFCMNDKVLKRADWCAGWYCKGIIISSFVGIFNDYIPNMNTIVNEKVTRVAYEVYINRFSGLFGDPNYYSVNLMLAFVLLFFLFLKKKIKGKIAYGSFIAIIVFGAMTGSKTFLLMLVIVTGFTIIELIKNKQYVMGTFLIISVVVGIMMVLSGRVTIFNTIISRVSQASSMSELTTERTDLWKMYFLNLIDHPLKMIVGNGFGKGYSFERYPHNTYLDFLDLLGILGTVLFLYAKKCACYSYIKSKNTLNYLPMIVIIIMYFSLSMISHYDMIYHIMISTMIIYYNEENISLF